MSLPRLSDLNIDDPILRAHYYKIVTAYIDASDSDLATYEIKLDEEYRPDLVAYRALGTHDLAWLVSLACDVTDQAESLPVGEVVYLPYPVWIRRSMREFMDIYGV